MPAADVAVANVLLLPVEAILARLDAREAMTSGYLAGERPAHPGWEHVETIERDGWAAVRFDEAESGSPCGRRWCRRDARRGRARSRGSRRHASSRDARTAARHRRP